MALASLAAQENWVITADDVRAFIIEQFTRLPPDFEQHKNYFLSQIGTYDLKALLVTASNYVQRNFLALAQQSHHAQNL
jgi:hypothetical protein